MPAVTVTQFAHTQHVPTDHGPQDEVWGCLEPLLNPAAKVQFKWPNTVYTIGRDPKKVDCAFPGIALMSASQFSIEITGYGTPQCAAVVTDLGSTNGTYVQGEAVGRGKSRTVSGGTLIACHDCQRSQAVPAELDDRFILWLFPAVAPAPPSRPPYEEVYHFEDVLGHGGYGVVKRARHRQENMLYAVKMVLKDHVSSGEVDNGETRKDQLVRLQNEIMILKRLHHPHIVSFKEVLFDNNEVSGCVLELMPGGDLEGYLRTYGVLAESNAKHLTRQICEALKYLHDACIIHRDLKPANILLSDTHPPIAKLTDFGLARIFEPAASLPKSVCGTQLYMAPEVTSPGHFEKSQSELFFASPELRQGKGYNEAVDSWSLGVTLSQMLWNRYPFINMDAVAFENSYLLELDHDLLSSSNDVSKECLEFIGLLLRYEPQLRISPDAALDGRLSSWLVTHPIDDVWVQPHESDHFQDVSDLEDDLRSFGSSTIKLRVPRHTGVLHEIQEVEERSEERLDGLWGLGIGDA
ncbi:kinase-like protein [Lentinus brumalis]|uniref:Kinase-like protein n=1 Tax=Lentinus brumalis TaxID=2498619 RepID=A0A371DFQ4_9APHY|nr:kinase-like protein [Polyporus brumalis]